MTQVRLSVNVDHVATLRNARGGKRPDPLRAAEICLASGAQGITVHLREDRRHIRDADVWALKRAAPGRLNLEMAHTEEMVAIALSLRPEACCIVPERRHELTTEGGLNVAAGGSALRNAIARLAEAGIEVALFVEPTADAVRAAAEAGAAAVEFHTGPYADATPDRRAPILDAIAEAARLAHQAGVICHAGHGLDHDNVGAVVAIPQIVEVSIGHALIATALEEGLGAAVTRMVAAIAAAR